MGSYIQNSGKFLFNSRNNLIDSDDYLTEELIQIILNNNVNYIQIYLGNKLKVKTYETLNERIFKIKPHIHLRLYGWAELDLKILDSLTHVQCLGIDNVNVKNEVGFCALTQLKELSFGSHNSTHYDFLEYLPATLEKLRIEPEDAANFKADIQPIKRFKNLQWLFILGHYKKLDETILSLPNLETLVLSKIKNIKDIDFVKNLAALKKLHLKSISIKNADVLAQLNQLKFLELYKIDCIQNLDFITHMTSLEHLFLQSMNKIQAFPALPESCKLRKIELWYMHQLRDFTALTNLKSLEAFACREMTKHEPEDFIPVLKNKHVKLFDIWFLTEIKRKGMNALFEAHGRSRSDVSFMYEDTDFN